MKIKGKSYRKKNIKIFKMEVMNKERKKKKNKRINEGKIMNEM